MSPSNVTEEAPTSASGHAYARCVLRVLITGMSGTGKSSLIQELRRRGYAAYDADDDGFTEPRDHGAWGWRPDRVQELLDRDHGSVLFFSGCSEEQAQFDFDLRVLLRAPQAVMIERIRNRTTNSFGKQDAELSQILADRQLVEPLLLRTADLVIETTMPVAHVAELVLHRVTGRSAAFGPNVDTPRSHPGRG